GVGGRSVNGRPRGGASGPVGLGPDGRFLGFPPRRFWRGRRRRRGLRLAGALEHPPPLRLWIGAGRPAVLAAGRRRPHPAGRLRGFALLPDPGCIRDGAGNGPLALHPVCVDPDPRGWRPRGVDRPSGFATWTEEIPGGDPGTDRDQLDRI